MIGHWQETVVGAALSIVLGTACASSEADVAAAGKLHAGASRAVAQDPKQSGGLPVQAFLIRDGEKVLLGLQQTKPTAGDPFVEVAKLLEEPTATSTVKAFDGDELLATVKLTSKVLKYLRTPAAVAFPEDVKRYPAKNLRVSMEIQKAGEQTPLVYVLAVAAPPPPFVKLEESKRVGNTITMKLKRLYKLQAGQKFVAQGMVNGVNTKSEVSAWGVSPTGQLGSTPLIADDLTILNLYGSSDESGVTRAIPVDIGGATDVIPHGVFVLETATDTYRAVNLITVVQP